MAIGICNSSYLAAIDDICILIPGFQEFFIPTRYDLLINFLFNNFFTFVRNCSNCKDSGAIYKIFWNIGHFCCFYGASLNRQGKDQKNEIEDLRFSHHF